MLPEPTLGNLFVKVAQSSHPGGFQPTKRTAPRRSNVVRGRRPVKQNSESANWWARVKNDPAKLQAYREAAAARRAENKRNDAEVWGHTVTNNPRANEQRVREGRYRGEEARSRASAPSQRGYHPSMINRQARGWDVPYDSTVNRFMDMQALEGQGSRGMSLPEFDRFMQENMPNEVAASKARHAGETSEGRATYAVRSGMSWSPTSPEQAARMGVNFNDTGYRVMPGKKHDPSATIYNQASTGNLPDAPSRAQRSGKAITSTYGGIPVPAGKAETVESLRAQGVAENGPQGWRYDEARRRSAGALAPIPFEVVPSAYKQATRPS